MLYFGKDIKWTDMQSTDFACDPFSQDCQVAVYEE